MILDADFTKESVVKGRFGEAIEQAKAALFLASDDSSYMTVSHFQLKAHYKLGGLIISFTTTGYRLPSRRRSHSVLCCEFLYISFSTFSGTQLITLHGQTPEGEPTLPAPKGFYGIQ